MKQWLKYFLTGVAETAESATQTLSKILELKNSWETVLGQSMNKKTSNATRLLQYLFKKPVVHIKDVAEHLELSYKSANQLVNTFVEMGVLKEMTGQSRNRVFIFDAYMKLF